MLIYIAASLAGKAGNCYRPFSSEMSRSIYDPLHCMTPQAILANSPEPRFAALFSMVGSTLWLAGGCLSPFSPVNNMTTVWMLNGIATGNISALVWSSTSTSATMQATPGLAAGVMITFRNSTYVYGGSSFALTTTLTLAGIRLFPEVSGDFLTLSFAFNSTGNASGSINSISESTFFPDGDGWGLLPPTLSAHTQHPYGSIGHSLTVVGNQALLFGGLNPLGRTVFSALWSAAPGPSQVAWVLVRPALSPDARFAHTAVRVAGRFLVFGGFTPSRQTLSDLWMFDQAAFVYQRIASVLDQAPSPRASHTAAVYLDRFMYIFGGVYVSFEGNPVFYNDLWSWDSTNQTWTQHNTTAVAPSPSPRAKHAAVFNGGTMIVFGGLTGASLTNDIWLYDVITGLWTAWSSPGLSNQSGPAPSPRCGHAAAVLYSPEGQPYLYVFGGRSDTAALGDTWVLPLSNMQATAAWSLLDLVPSPAPRFDHCVAVLGGASKLVIFGGIDMLNYTDGHSDTWSLVAGATHWTSLDLPDRGVPIFDCACVFANNASAGLYLVEGRSTMSFRSLDILSYVQLGCNAVCILVLDCVPGNVCVPLTSLAHFLSLTLRG